MRKVVDEREQPARKRKQCDDKELDEVLPPVLHELPVLQQVEPEARQQPKERARRANRRCTSTVSRQKHFSGKRVAPDSGEKSDPKRLPPTPEIK